jgi:hypothetical protein
LPTRGLRCRAVATDFDDSTAGTGATGTAAVRAGATFACLLSAACALRSPDWSASPWPAADRLFHSDARWRGADAAFSIDLGGGRTLWLFGDSFVARPGAVGRRGCAMVRNSIAAQDGPDPSRARIEFHWRGGERDPASFFPEDGAVWHWPLHGIRLGHAVTVFCARVTSSGEQGPFGFRAVGWTAFRIGDVDSPPARWSVERLPTPASAFPVVVGHGVVASPDWIHVFAQREPGDHALLLARWPRPGFARGDLDGMQWYDRGAWRPHAELTGSPAPVLAEGAPEFSVSADPDGGWRMAQSLGFCATDLALRTAPVLTGPWSEPRVVFRPEESGRSGVFVYAGKAHPQLEGADLVLTYASNAFDFARLVDDASLYFPRFVRLVRR